MMTKAYNIEKVARRNKILSLNKVAISLVILLNTININNAQADDVIKGKYFQIKQEVIKKKDGVLIVKPKMLDQEVKEFLFNNHIKTLDDYAEWLRNNITYKKERTDRWANPLVTLSRKYGDCEDFTYLNMIVLRVLGYSPKFIAVFGKSRGHAVCVFKKGNEYYYFDNEKLIETQENSVLGLAQSVKTYFAKVEIRELDLDSKKWNILYKKV